ncbi:MAG: M67 family metallopeptidase [Kiritimatiellae bacterium]|jgi:proteasome lid subunit RPN8/RPN11|nr:M67 family metallopeptidase [Kiritimatiellia bacterium]MDD4342593.1 M67 family metallopeptidase [Kiritimatiellia bacterium]MDY0148461.1 M67 family metallopeptidase [Kiritimatiellia bacterium]
MLVIPKNILDALIAHGRAGFPLETCGILSGNGGVVSEFHPMTNVDQSRVHFLMEPREQFAVAKELRVKGKEMLAVYHTHPDTPARPSAEDIRLAKAPGVSTVILSLAGPAPDLKSFRIFDGVSTPEPIDVPGAGE